MAAKYDNNNVYYNKHKWTQRKPQLNMKSAKKIAAQLVHL